MLRFGPSVADIPIYQLRYLFFQNKTISEKLTDIIFDRYQPRYRHVANISADIRAEKISRYLLFIVLLGRSGHKTHNPLIKRVNPTRAHIHKTKKRKRAKNLPLSSNGSRAQGELDAALHLRLRRRPRNQSSLPPLSSYGTGESTFDCESMTSLSTVACKFSLPSESRLSP